MIQRILIALASLALMTSAPFAQTGPAFADPPEQDLRAAPGSIAIGILEQAGATDIFDVMPSSQAEVRHTASDLTCSFGNQGELGRVLVFPGLPHGDDVGCDFSVDTGWVTYYATRYPNHPSLADSLQDAAAAIEMRFDNARPYTWTPHAELAPSDVILPQSLHAAFIVPPHDAAPMYFTSVSVATIDGWHYKLRFSQIIANEAGAAAAQARAAGYWSEMLGDVLRARTT